MWKAYSEAAFSEVDKAFATVWGEVEQTGYRVKPPSCQESPACPKSGLVDG